MICGLGTISPAPDSAASAAYVGVYCLVNNTHDTYFIIRKDRKAMAYNAVKFT